MVVVLFVATRFVIASSFVVLLNVNAALPLKLPPSLYCTCVLEPPGVPLPPLPVMQTPFTLTQPARMLIPFENVEVAVAVLVSSPISVPPASGK